MSDPRERLRGLRIALTRSAADNARWARELRELGASAIDWPCIETRHLSESAARLRARFAAADWIAVASRRTVAALCALAPEIALADKRWACVGQGTARAAREAGARELFVSGEGSAESLARDLLARLDDSERVLLLGAADGRPDFARAFAGAGRVFEQLALYETRRSAPGAPAELPPVDAVFFASPSAAQAFFEAGTLESRASGPLPLLLSIGPSTSAALTGSGQALAGEATTRDLAGLCQALAGALDTGAVPNEPKP